METSISNLNKQLVSKILCFLPIDKILKLKGQSTNLSAAADVALKNYPCVMSLDAKTPIARKKLFKLIDTHCHKLRHICYSKKPIEEIDFTNEVFIITIILFKYK